MAISWRAIDGDAGIHQLLTEVIDILDPVGEVTEIATAGIFLGIPVISQLNLGAFLTGGAQENEGKAPLRYILATHFLKAKMLTVKSQALIKDLPPHHGV